MNEDEEFLFQREMADVKPLQRAERVALQRDPLSESIAQRRRAAAVAEQEDSNYLDDHLPSRSEGFRGLNSQADGSQDSSLLDCALARITAIQRFDGNASSARPSG